MAGVRSHLRPVGRLALALSLVLGSGLALPASPAVAVAGSATFSRDTSFELPTWTGGVSLYRSGTFTTQKTWLWCTAADVQIIRNIVRRQADHSRASQQTYFNYMRAHNRYRIPVSDGVDPAGWAAGLKHYVDSRYTLTSSRTFSDALRSSVIRMRQTNLPVGITVSHGNHAWILTGFTATADPAKTRAFTVTSVRVVGPLYGLQSRTYGYDMAPNKKLTPAQLKTFFTPWHYGRIRMVYEGRYISVQPVPRTSTSAAAPAPKATPKPAPAAAAKPKPLVASSPSAPTTTSPVSSPVASVASAAGPIGEDGPTTGSGPPVGPAVGLLAIVAALALTGLALARRPHGRLPTPSTR